MSNYFELPVGHADPGAETKKAKQANVRLTEEQARLLRQHCIRTGLSTQDAIVAALRHVIDGF